MTHFLELLPKELAICLILSPFFLSVFVLARIFMSVTDKVHKRYKNSTLYWVILTLFLSVLAVIGLIRNGNFATVFVLLANASGAYSTYLSLKKKQNKQI